MHHLDRSQVLRGRTMVILLALGGSALAAGGVGFLAGQSLTPPAPPAPAVTTASPVAIAPAPSTTEINALAARLGEMQAELLRLNALGARLVQMSGLDPEEFDFDRPPPQGGPAEGTVRDYTIKELVSELGSVANLIDDRQRKLGVLEDVVMERGLQAQALPTNWPVKSGYITSNFGYRVHPTRKVRLFHSGVDFASPRGTPIAAAADGVVTFSGRRNGYGRVVDIRHVDGLVTRYAHNSKNLVEEGQLVRKGQKIATVGSSGVATGPHVHFEVLKDGEPVDPMGYLGKTPKRTLAAAGAGRSGG
ncbi:M23 family metallopeptidase [Marichromatium bheemlicum]|uniref:M23 family metallopeptidase n=1 Tax=Marichromatium bheemlicum TaxID=365339 RepID=A0ABX1I5Q1_9GAMM|nr:M23 family metallopeptidase [Marichromatium bheemlicum]NKN32369.1 M23 family metallopeptidase [Marichromatium bheemlicum]